jgi:hypothetical protein
MPRRRFASMEDVMAAAGASDRTIRNWMERGLLPTPVKVSLGYPKRRVQPLPGARVRAGPLHRRHARAEGLSFDEIKVLVAARDWSKAGRAPPAEVESRDGAPPTRPAGRRS